MCCGDDENGWCEHLEVNGTIGEPLATRCRIFERRMKAGTWEEFLGCNLHPRRPVEIYPWYRCGYRFVEDGD
jgi:hypothetical protein